jgi:carboxylesterase type B
VESPSLGPLATVDESEFAYNNLTIRTGCAGSEDTFGCLRNLDVNNLQKENYNLPFPNASLPPIYLYRPTIDGNLVSDHTYHLYGQGKFMKVPVIFGFDSNEGTIFTPHRTSTIDEADQFLQANFPSIQKAQLDKVNSMYMSRPDDPVYQGAGKYWQGISKAYGEIRYICPAIYISSAYNSHCATALSNWGYHYAVIDSDAITSGYGTTHTIEVNAIWGPQYVSTKPPISYSTSNGEIVPLMQRYWTSFIRSYNPNTYRAAGSPEWQPWGDEYKQIFIQTEYTKMVTLPGDRKTRCKYLQSIARDLAQ